MKKMFHKKPWLTLFSYLFLLLPLSFMLIGGCGYSTRSTLPANIRTIHIAAFKNKINYSTEKTSTNTYFPLLETKIRQAVADRFLFDGNLRVSDAERSDLTLVGELTRYNREVLRYTDNNDVQEYRIQITVNLKMFNKSQELLWEESNFIGDTTYFVSGALAKSEATAVEDALVDLARRIVERTVEDW